MTTDNKIYFGLDNNNSTCIIKCDMDVLNHVREHFSVENTQARFQRLVVMVELYREDRIGMVAIMP